MSPSRILRTTALLGALLFGMPALPAQIKSNVVAVPVTSNAVAPTGSTVSTSTSSTPPASVNSTTAKPDPGPPINANLKDALYHLPIAGIKTALDSLFGALKKGESGGYAAKTAVDVPGLGSVPLQMYFFGKDEKQALLLVVNKTLSLPPVFNNHTWKKLEGASLSDPIFSVSTVDFLLGVSDMPADFQKVIASSYYNVSALSFTSGFQVASRINLGAAMKTVIGKGLGFSSDDFTLRAGLVIPVPSDPASSAQLAAEIAADMKNVDKVLKDQPNFFVEFQPKPGTVITPMGMSSLKLTDSTISLDYKLTLGFKGNIILPSGKKFITFFYTPLTPEGAMDFSDYQFGFTAQTATEKDLIELNLAMATPKAPGGSFVKGIDKYRDQLNTYLNAFTVFEIRNPNTVGDYVFGDKNKPFPPKGVFNLLILGPTASESDSTGGTISGPYFRAAGNVRVLQQTLGTVKLTIGDSGLHGLATAALSLKLGPLGKTGINMTASADVTHDKQSILVHGNALGRELDASLTPNNLVINSPATCATPFSLSESVSFQPVPDLSALMDALGGVNVDPAKISGCLGNDLKKAYQWVSTTGASLGGYTAQQATADLKKITDAEAAAAQAAQAAYNQAKDLARNKANQAQNAAMNSFRAADNAFKKLGGKKKKHHSGPDPRFAESVFDWDYYYDHAPDVVAAGVDLATHWTTNGFLEGRQGALEFNARFYLARYPDVQQQCGGDLMCALNHWLNEGMDEGRQGSADFSVTSYLDRYPDLRAAFGASGYQDAIDHWVNYGQDEGRDPSPQLSATGPVSGGKLAGGTGGNPWSDRYNVCSGDQYVTGFFMHNGSSIDSVQFQYSNGQYGPLYGRQGRDFTVNVTLPPGEYFVRVDYAAGSRVDKLQFTTNLGRVFGPWGGGSFNGSYTVTPGQKLGCMFGRAGGAIDQLVFSSTGPR